MGWVPPAPRLVHGPPAEYVRSVAATAQFGEPYTKGTFQSIWRSARIFCPTDVGPVPPFLSVPVKVILAGLLYDAPLAGAVLDAVRSGERSAHELEF